LLKEHKVWNEQILFVNDEHERAAGQPVKGWGEYIANTVIAGSTTLATRIATFTDKHVATTNPTHPAPPSDQVIATAAIANARTAGLAEKAEQGAVKVGEYIHDAGVKIGQQLPDSIAKPATGDTGEKGEFRKLAEDGWTQISIAAKGIASAAGTVAGSVSENAHKAVEHNFGKQAEKVAQGELSISPSLALQR
jgi:hypothetical protein